MDVVKRIGGRDYVTLLRRKGASATRAPHVAHVGSMRMVRCQTGAVPVGDIFATSGEHKRTATTPYRDQGSVGPIAQHRTRRQAKMPTVIGTRRRSKALAEDVLPASQPLNDSTGIDPGPLRTSSPSDISASDASSPESDTGERKFRQGPSSPAQSPRFEHAPTALPPPPPPPPPQERTSSWADVDPSVLLALSAPVGSWLTGGDHVKTLFLVLLLIVYLHQLITGAC
jgi:hypothetical protein